MSTSRIAVTGATGRVGGRVAGLLSEQGAPLRLLARDPSRLPALDGAEVVQVNYEDPNEIENGLAGIDVVLFVSAPDGEHVIRNHDTFIHAAMDAGVGHMVYLSYYGAERDATYSVARSHWHTERTIKDHCPHWTLIRDNIYADLLPTWMGEDGVIRGPAKRGKVAPVAIDDIAAVAATVLLNPAAHDRAVYELTGPEAFTFAQIADLVTEVTGRACKYEHQSAADAYERIAGTCQPWQAEAKVSAYQAAAAGELGDVTGDVEAVLGRPATPVREVLARNLA